jgi:hypothetical protein
MLEYSVTSGFALSPIACYTTASNCYLLSLIVVPSYEVHNYFLMISSMATIFVLLVHALVVSDQ